MTLINEVKVISYATVVTIFIIFYIKLGIYKLVWAIFVLAWGYIVSELIQYSLKNGKISMGFLGWIMGIGQSDIQTSDGIISQVSGFVTRISSEICLNFEGCDIKENSIKLFVWMFVIIIASRFSFIAIFSEDLQNASTSTPNTRQSYLNPDDHL